MDSGIVSLTDIEEMKTFIDKILEDNIVFNELKGIVGRHDESHTCNLLSIEITDSEDNTTRFTKEQGRPAESMDALKHEELGKDLDKQQRLTTYALDNVFSIDSNKLCQFEVNKQYLQAAHRSSSISLMLYSKNINTRAKANSYILCGLLFLKELKEQGKKTLYIPLICCKKGIGRGFLSLAEKIAEDLNYDKITLNSMDPPLGFYIKKGYQFEPGLDRYYKLKNKIDLNVFKTNSEALKHALYQSTTGYYPLLTEGTKYSFRRLGRRQNIQTATHLDKIKMVGDEIKMFKNFGALQASANTPPNTPANVNADRSSRRRSSRRRSLRHNPYGRAGGGRKLGYMGGKRTNIRRTNKSKRKSKRKVKR